MPTPALCTSPSISPTQEHSIALSTIPTIAPTSIPSFATIIPSFALTKNPSVVFTDTKTFWDRLQEGEVTLTDIGIGLFIVIVVIAIICVCCYNKRKMGNIT